MHGRPAGLRTHTIVGLASTTFMVVSTHFVYFQRYAAGDFVMVDPSRIAASVVTGIGFLGRGSDRPRRAGPDHGGGLVARRVHRARGRGGRMYALSALATALGVLTLTVLRRFEHKDDGMLRRRISITLTGQAPRLSYLLGALHTRGVRAAATGVRKASGGAPDSRHARGVGAGGGEGAVDRDLRSAAGHRARPNRAARLTKWTHVEMWLPPPQRGPSRYRPLRASWPSTRMRLEFADWFRSGMVAAIPPRPIAWRLRSCQTERPRWTSG